MIKQIVALFRKLKGVKREEKTKWTLDEWFQESQQGLRCGMLACFDKPVVQCSHCHLWYCNKHKNSHFNIKGR